jgi:mycofactocin precursor
MEDCLTGGLMDTTTITEPQPAAHADDDTLVEEELLVEEISIDGMCGVY